MTVKQEGPGEEAGEVEIAQPGWWEPFYDELLAAILMEGHNKASLEATVDALIEILELRPGARVLDQCCGFGRLSLPLAARGFDVLGIDQAANYIELGNKRAASADHPPRLESADAFAFVADPPCDGVFNWWTSFGYAREDARNQEMIQRAFESLVPGGRFALDFVNVPGVMHNFQRVTLDRQPFQGGELVLTRESAFDLPRGMLRKRWTYYLDDGRRVVRPSEVRLYLPHQIGAMMEAVGFEAIRYFGDEQGGELTMNSPRCIISARRPA